MPALIITGVGTDIGKTYVSAGIIGLLQDNAIPVDAFKPVLSGYDAVWLIFLTMAVRSAGAGIQMPAVSALIPQITPARNLMRVNGINGSIQSAMALLAPAAAGAIYAWSSAANEGSAAGPPSPRSTRIRGVAPSTRLRSSTSVRPVRSVR